MTRRSLGLALVLGLVAWAPGATATAADENTAIDALLHRLDAAIAAHDLDAALAAYDPSATDVRTRAKAAVQGWLAFADVRVGHRVAQVTGTPELAEAIVLRKVTYSEHGRPQVDIAWHTVGLSRVGGSWLIAAEDERPYLRAVATDLAIELHPEAGTLHGSSRIALEATASGEDSLVMNLNRGLEIKSMTDDQGRPLPHERDADLITVPQDVGLRAGDKRTVTIVFEGKLFNEAKEQGYSQVAITPAGSFASWVTSWYPRLGGGGSKSKGRISYDVPAGVTVASSGRLASEKSAAGRSRQVFTIDRPLDFSFAAARYFHREETVDGTHLGVYFLTGGEAKAVRYLGEAAQTLRCERGLYGDYPFDGYAVVEIPAAETGVLGGSSEQGMNLFPTGMLPDTEFPLLLLGHEIGHSWWGNLVGSADGAMLSEGLAQISAVLCLREVRGEAAMRAFLQNGVPGYGQSAALYFAQLAKPGKDAPLGLPPAGADAAAALHDLADTKGMFVYAMLRDKIGHAAFLAGLRSVVRQFAGKDAHLADLRAAWEAASRKDLKPFFAQWLERTGAPELALESRIEPAGKGHVVSGVLTQIGDVYDLDIEVALGFAGRHETRTVTLSGAVTPFSFQTDAKPLWVVLDPDGKILRFTPALRNRALLADGVALASVGKRQEGCARIDEFVTKAPDSLEGHLRAGVCAEDDGKLDAAEKRFRFVLDRHASLGGIEPAVTLAELHLGYVLDLAGRRQAALAAYRQVLRLPDSAGAHAGAQAGLAAAHRATAVAPARAPK